MPYFSSSYECPVGFHRPGYKILLKNAYDQFIMILPWVNVSYAGAVNSVGNMTLTIPARLIPKEVVQDNYRIEVWRTVEGNTRLDLDTAWIIKGIKLILTEQGQYAWELNAQTLLVILRSRIVAYNQSTAQAAKSDNTDDMMKAVMRENFSSSATDTDRRISTTYLSIQADVSLGGTIQKAFEYRPVLELFTEIAEASIATAQPVFFDIILNGSTAEFKTKVYQWGQDRRSGQSGALVLSPERLNVGPFTITDDYTEEATFIYAFGPGNLGARMIATAENATRVAKGPFNRIEKGIQGSNDANATRLTEEANAELQLNRPKRVVEGSIRQAARCVYGKDWGMGDRMTFKPRSDWSFDVRVDAVQVAVSESKEEISAYFRG